MALKPILKVKVDELFLRWLSENETQQVLRENLYQISHGEALTQPSPRGGFAHKPSSPRHRPGSPILSTSSSKFPSPRSPRRPLVSKNNIQNSSGTENKVRSFSLLELLQKHKLHNFWMLKEIKIQYSMKIQNAWLKLHKAKTRISSWKLFSWIILQLFLYCISPKSVLNFQVAIS